MDCIQPIRNQLKEFFFLLKEKTKSSFRFLSKKEKRLNTVQKYVIWKCSENETLKTAIIIGVGVLAIYVAYQIYNKYKEDEAKKHQHTRN